MNSYYEMANEIYVSDKQKINFLLYFLLTDEEFGLSKYAKDPIKYIEKNMNKAWPDDEWNEEEFKADKHYQPVDLIISCMTIYHCIQNKILAKDCKIDFTSYANRLYSVYRWQFSKITYSFNSVLDKAIMSMSSIEDGKIPLDVLKNLPHKHFFISFQPRILYGEALTYLKFRGQDDSETSYILGAMIDIEDDYSFITINLMKYRKKNNGVIFVPNIIGLRFGETIDDYLKRMYEDYTGNSKEDSKTWSFEQERELFLINLKLVMPYLLYLSAENADVTRDSKNKKLYKKRTIPKNDEREVKLFNVGNNYEIKVRKFKRAYEESHSKEHKADVKKMVSPHVRRAHYRHQWVGSGKNKRIKLIWIEESFIHPELFAFLKPTNVKME